MQNSPRRLKWLPMVAFVAVVAGLAGAAGLEAAPVARWSADVSTFGFSDIPTSLRLSGFNSIAYPRVVNAGTTNLLFAQIGSGINGGSILYRDIGADGKKTNGPWQVFKQEVRYTASDAGSWAFRYTNANPINVNGKILVSYSSRGQGSYVAGEERNGWLNYAALDWNGSTLVPVNTDGTLLAKRPLDPNLEGNNDPARADKGNPNGDNRVLTIHNWEPRMVKPSAFALDGRLDMYYTNAGLRRISSTDFGLTWTSQQTVDLGRQMATPLRMLNGETLAVSEVRPISDGEGWAYYFNADGTMTTSRDDITSLVGREQAPFITQVSTGEVLLSVLDGNGGGRSFLIGDANGEDFARDLNPTSSEGGALLDWSRPFTNGYWGDIAVLGGNAASNDFIATMGISSQISVRTGVIVPEPGAIAMLGLAALALRRRLPKRVVG